MSCLGSEDEKFHYFNNPNFSDVTIHFSGHEVKAHRVTLATHSGYFRKMFESEFLEASVRDVHLFEDDPDACLGGKPIIRPNNSIELQGDFNGEEGRGYFKYIVRVYGAADKYRVLGLMTFVEHEFEKEVQWLQKKNTPFPNTDEANELVSTLEQLAELLYHSFGDVADVLRLTLSKAVHKRTLELMDNTRYKQMVKNIPEFAVDLLELATRAMKDLDLQVPKKTVS